MSCAELQDWARREEAAPGAVARALWEERSLVRVWCMRGTLHLLTREQHRLYTASFQPETLYTDAWLEAFQVSAADLAALSDAVSDVLAGGESLTRRDLAEAVTARLGERLGERLRSSWGELLKPMARRGVIVNGPGRGQEITYVRVDRWLDGTGVGGGASPVDPGEAAAEYLRRYLAAYGPASRKDYARWLGMRLMRPVNEAFARLGDEVAQVRVAGRPLLALRSDLDELAAAPDPAAWEAEPPIRLLPGFDTFVLGHADRDHLVPPERKPLVYRTAGWVSPTILAGGVVIGTWEHEVKGGDLAVRLSPFDRLRRSARAAAEAEARRLAAFFGRRLALYT
jgi:hypothetical protein